jgi:mRNA interferase MazF
MEIKPPLPAAGDFRAEFYGFGYCATDGAPLFRLPIHPNIRNRLRVTSRLMMDKITTVPKSKLRARVGRLDDEDILRLNHAVLVFLGLALSPRSSRKS